MALEKVIRYSEKDIEDWMWNNPDEFYYVDGWLGRQMELGNGGRLDLLGYKSYANIGCALVLVELKSNPIKIDDILQVVKYRYFLKEMLDMVNIQNLQITTIVIGTDRRIHRDMLETARTLDVFLFDASINKDDEIKIGKHPWRFTYDYYEEITNKSKWLINEGRYEKLFSVLARNGVQIRLEGITEDENGN